MIAQSSKLKQMLTFALKIVIHLQKLVQEHFIDLNIVHSAQRTFSITGVPLLSALDLFPVSSVPLTTGFRDGAAVGSLLTEGCPPVES